MGKEKKREGQRDKGRKRERQREKSISLIINKKMAKNKQNQKLRKKIGRIERDRYVNNMVKRD